MDIPAFPVLRWGTDRRTQWGTTEALQPAGLTYLVKFQANEQPLSGTKRGNPKEWIPEVTGK